MKLTKSQLKQLIKEAFTNEMTDSQLIAQNRLDINDLYSETRRIRAEFEDSIEELTAKLYDSLSTGEKPSRFAEPEAEREWTAKPTTDTNPGGRRPPEEDTITQLEQIIKEEVEEAIKKKELNEGIKEIVLAFLMGTAAMLPTTDEAWAAETKENPVLVYDKILSDVKIPDKKRQQALRSFLKFKKQTKVPTWRKKAENWWENYKKSKVYISPDVKYGKPWMRVNVPFKRDSDLV